MSLPYWVLTNSFNTLEESIKFFNLLSEKIIKEKQLDLKSIKSMFNNHINEQGYYEVRLSYPIRYKENDIIKNETINIDLRPDKHANTYASLNIDLKQMNDEKLNKYLEEIKNK